MRFLFIKAASLPAQLPHHRWGAPVAVAPRGLRPPLARAPDGGHDAAANSHLPERCREMNFHHAFSDVQLARYHLVRKTGDDERKHLRLSMA
jgi:hypothetical protein